MVGKKKVVATLVVLMLTAVAISPAFVTDDSEDADALALSTKAFLVGFAMGVILTTLFYEVFDNPDVDEHAGQIEELKKNLAKSEKQLVYTAMRNCADLIGSVMPADSQMVFFTQNYWDQAMEYQVYEYWTLDNIGQYKKYCKELLAGTGFLETENNYLYTWSDAFDHAFNRALDRSVLWTGDTNYEYTDLLTVSFEWDGNTVKATNGEESGKISLDLTQQITTTKDTYVYIDVLNEVDNFDASRSGMMYLYNVSGSKTIQNVDTGAYYQLNVGANDITGYPAGIYKLPGGASYAGPMISVIGDNSAPVHASLVLKKGSELYYVTPYSDAQYQIRSSGGQTWTTSTLNICVDDGTLKKNVSLLGEDGGGPLLNYYEDLVTQFNDIASNTYTTGEATWTIFDTIEESNSAIHPSSIPINVKGQNLSMVEKVYLTIHAMAQMKEYYESHEESLDGMEITFTSDSLDLFCYGNLYYNGQLWAENVVFTPYISGSDQHLEIGMNDWNGSGYMAMWAKVDDYSSWDNVVKTSSPIAPLDKTYALEIKKIVSHGKEVQSIDLVRSVLVASSQDSGDDEDPPTPVPKMFDASILWMVILIEAAIILMLLGYIVGNNLLMSLGIILLIVGVVFPDAISSIAMGTFTVSDLKPFNWI